MTLRVHLDTDLGGDMDDLCALAMLLRWPEPVEVTGITVVGDTGGVRTGMVRQALAIAGREDIPVAAGADTSGGYYAYPLTLPEASRYWPEPVVPSPNPVDDAIALMKQSLDAGAMLIAIGPLTNLRLFDERYPGELARANYVQMGGFVFPPREGYPAWRNDYDFNVQVDAESAYRVLSNTTPLLVTLAMTAETSLREAHLPRLRAGDPLARLIARQADALIADSEPRHYADCPNVPDDHLNFQHDGLAMAIALGWREGVTIERMPLRVELRDGLVTQTPDPAGRPFNVVTAIDGPKFDAMWLDVVTSKGGSA